MKIAAIIIASISLCSCSVSFDAEGKPIVGFNPTPEDIRAINDALQGGTK